MSLNDQVYVVTGASSGFGKAIAEALLANDARVALLARNKEKLEEVFAEQLEKERAIALSCDVGKAEQIKTALQQTEDFFGQVNGLINNAGVARPGKIESLTLDDILLQTQTNFVGTVLGCQLAIPYLKKHSNSRIVTISSASAWHYDEMAHLSIYAATKAAVERFTRDLRQECQEYNIGVTCVRPGAAMTDFAGAWDFEKLQLAVAEWQKSGPEMDSGMEAEHVAEAVLHCLLYPAHVAVDLLEVRPSKAVEKIKF